MPVAMKPIFDTISFSVEIDLKDMPISNVVLAYTDSVRARHHYEMFIADLKTLTRNCKSFGFLPGVIGGRVHPYTEDSFRPLFPVKIDGKVEAFASIMDEIPVSKLTPEPTYACKIWMKDSIEARSFILNRLHISIKRQFDESAWIAVFTDVVLRISSSQQQVMCKGAVFNE